jgi:hypothetical protein
MQHGRGDVYRQWAILEVSTSISMRRFQYLYPGEALLLWSRILECRFDRSQLERFSRSFHWYSRWHERNRNPAFVPWHTMACVRLSMYITDSPLVDTVFRMNDWLLGIQQWHDSPWEDCRDRLYSPIHPYGPFHASSTAVYGFIWL